MKMKGTATCVRGYHVYQAILEVAVGEVLMYERELGNVTTGMQLQ